MFSAAAVLGMVTDDGETAREAVSALVHSGRKGEALEYFKRTATLVHHAVVRFVRSDLAGEESANLRVESVHGCCDSLQASRELQPLSWSWTSTTASQLTMKNCNRINKVPIFTCCCQADHTHTC